MTTTTTSEVQFLTPSQLKESPTNRRQHFGDLDELAKSIAGVGVLQPLLARPRGIDFELVFGHRRLRAAKLAKVEIVPVIVRQMTDLQALEAQLVENVGRADIHPLEEAEYYEQLHAKHGLSVDDIAAKAGKSRASVYARMKLLALTPEARKAFYADLLTPSTALYLARVPADLQKEALKDLTRKGYDGDLPSAREAFHIVATRYMLKLADAPFDRGDAELLPKAGACTACPKRTGNQKELFGDIKSPDVCTDPTCFDEKRKAHAKAETKRLEDEGITVLAGERNKYGHGRMEPPKGYVKLDDVDYQLSYRQTAGQILKAAAETGDFEIDRTVFVDDGGKMVDIVAKRLVLAAAKKAKIGGAHKARPWSPPQKSPHKKARERAYARVREVALGRVTKEGSSDVAWRAVGARGYYGGPKGQQKVTRAKGGELVALVLGAAVHEYLGIDDPVLRVLAEGLKIDSKAILAEELAKVKASTPAAKPGKKPGK